MLLELVKKRMALKIAMYVGGFILLIQTISGAISFYTSHWVMEEIRRNLLKDTHNSLDLQEKNSFDSLKRNVSFSNDMLATLMSGKLYNVESPDSTILPFLKNPEVIAVMVKDEEGSIYGAGWKQNGQEKTGQSLPENISLSGLFSHEASSIYEGDSVGKVTMYYTDQLLKEEFKKIEEKTIHSFEKQFQNLEKIQFNVGMYQIGFLLIILMVILFLVVKLLQKMIKPLRDMVQFINQMSRGRIDGCLNLNREDEIGTMANALDGFIVNLEKKVKFAEEVAHGNLSTEVELASEDDKLGQSLQMMSQDLGEIINNISMNAITLASSSEEMTTISNDITKGTKEMSDQSSLVAAAGEEMAANVGVMASGTEQMSANIQSISATSTQMSQNMVVVSQSMDGIAESISDVADKSQNSSEISKKAKGMSSIATEAMANLSLSAHEIGEVTEMIKELAQRTNLLALNANIEAASAGEAGKGFAVVANEIKELAKQSAESAQEIALKVTGIQENTEKSEVTILDMSKIVTDISDASNSITELAVHQRETMQVMVNNIKESTLGVQDIARLIGEMSQGATENATSAAELTQGSTEVSKNLSSLDRLISNTSKGIVNVNTESKSLSKLAAQLQTMVKKFNL